MNKAYNKIIDCFWYIEFWDCFERDVEGLLSYMDGLGIDELLTPFKDEIKCNLVLLSKEKQITYLKSLLSNRPLYLRDENFNEERCFVMDHIKNPENGINNGLRKDYIIFTYQFWTRVQEVIKEGCIIHDIECIEEDLNGIKNIRSFYLLKNAADYKEDLSNTTPTEKIIYLNEVGIINFLKVKHPFKNNVNRLATLLSAITGENHTTISSTLNVIINNPESSKNPYNAKKMDSVNKVLAELKKIGFDPIKRI